MCILLVACHDDVNIEKPKMLPNSFKFKSNYSNKVRIHGSCEGIYQLLQFPTDSTFLLEVKCIGNEKLGSIWSIGKVYQVNDSAFSLESEFSHYTIKLIDENSISILSSGGKVSKFLNYEYPLTYDSTFEALVLPPFYREE